MRYMKPLTLFQDLLKTKALEKGRLLGLDVGDKYVGLAVSDLHNKIASPLSVLVRKKTNIDLMAGDLQSLISELSLVSFIVGYPFDRQKSSPDAVQVKIFVDDLCKTGKLEGLRYTYWNECFTSKNAELLLKPLKLHPVEFKTILDKFAAVGILQGYLDYVNRNEMNSTMKDLPPSAGIAFTPHVIYVASGEDIAAKILSFSQQKPRAICIMSASGGVSAVTLRQPASSGRNVTYEGCFEILCLSGSYLVAETGGSDNRTGGVNVALSSPDGHVIGGALGGRLIASRPVQVVISSFVYGRSSRTESGILPTDSGQANVSPSRNFSPATGLWSGSEAMDPKNPNTDINLMHG